MTINRRRFLKTTAGTILAAPALMNGALASNHGPIKFVSILDQSGGLDIYGKPMVDATKMAIDEMNEGGGLLGRKIDLKVTTHNLPFSFTLNSPLKPLQVIVQTLSMRE